MRRDLHRHPELAFEEIRTSGLVAETLKSFGIPVRRGLARTGVVGFIDGALPGPSRMLRADMDALPILEENIFDFVSTVPGKMHACGHDGHTAMLLTAAQILQELREELHGSVRLIFQPAEEKVPGGAKPMIEDGCLAPLEGRPSVGTAFGQHVRPDLPSGTIGVRAGAFMAASDEVFITITGQGGHAAEPHLLRSDPVHAAAHVITALQSVISRNRPPDVPSVLSFCKVDAGDAPNVIPDRVVLGGTFRSMDDTWRFRGHDLITRVAEHTAAAFGAKADVDIHVGYPTLVNDQVQATRVRRAAEEYVGPDHVVDLDRWYVAEDFAYYLREVPGCYYTLGIRNEPEGIVHGLHTPRMTVDEPALATGAGFLAYLAWHTGANPD
ncbi:MAG: amidohydrolase [Rhodothermales bacterium]|nr:amidohydrolase [Rhodothermales bacterium]